MTEIIRVERFRMRKGSRWVVRYRAKLGDSVFAYEGPVAQTPRDAKTALLESAAKALGGIHLPRWFRFGDRYAVIYRIPSGWWYEVASPETPAYEDGVSLRVGSIGPFDSVEEAERALRRHMAQLLMDPRRDYTAEEIVDPRDLESHRSYYRWQAGYAYAMDMGLPDEACRQVAERYERGEDLESALGAVRAQASH